MRKSKNAKNANAESYIDIMEKNHMEIPWHDYAVPTAMYSYARQV